MKDFRVAMMQLNFPQANGIDHRLAKMERWVRTAVEQGADLVWFGELAVGSYILDSSALTEPGTGSSLHYRRAEEVPGPATQRLAAIAREYGVFIVSGIGDLQAGVVYNAGVVVGPDGYVGKQRKTHMPLPEYRYYGRGSHFQVFDIGLCKLGISICYDNWFPETSRILAVKGAEVLLSPWMWIIPHEAAADEKARAIARRRETHIRMFAARAMDNAMYVLVLDHVGLEAENFEFPGVSMAFNPFGELIAEAQPLAEQMLLVDLKAAEVEKYRTYGHMYTLTYRRPEIYGPLTEMP
jgi:predicted amidohydrolase